MNQYKKLPACLYFLPALLSILLCFLFTGHPANAERPELNHLSTDTLPAPPDIARKIYQ